MPGEALLHAALANPFARGSEWAQASARLRRVDLAEAVGAALRAGDAVRAEQLVLAVGQARACEEPGEPASALGERHLPRAVERRLPRERAAYLRIVMAAARCSRALQQLRGSSSAMQAVRREAWAACFGQSLRHALELEQLIHDHDVLLLGETGTGKEAVAIALLEGAPGPADGSPAPRAMLNVAAIPETLVESELFGHVRGAFTGATRDRKGRIRSAAGGCLFLDEVGDLPLTTQVKLLRVMENDLVAPIGSDVEHVANARYIGATHKPLDELADRGLFRRDLYERFAGHVIRLPPLRERPEDLLEIGRGILDAALGEQTLVERPPIERWLRGSTARSHHWKGNVRELENVLRDLMLGLDPQLEPARSSAGQPAGNGLPEAIRDLRAPLREVVEWYVQRVFETQGRNAARTARALGVDRTTLRRRLGKG
ncbi:MAG: sigma-54-dependent Fis family transcriptional regulator [Polyangiaceae bacterium]|nr:sigma-54-dependent Fis family transcriptional regulator [Polyangiaceae bacterium]